MTKFTIQVHLCYYHPADFTVQIAYLQKSSDGANKRRQTRFILSVKRVMMLWWNDFGLDESLKQTGKIGPAGSLINRPQIQYNTNTTHNSNTNTNTNTKTVKIQQIQKQYTWNPQNPNWKTRLNYETVLNDFLFDIEYWN